MKRSGNGSQRDRSGAKKFFTRSEDATLTATASENGKTRERRRHGLAAAAILLVPLLLAAYVSRSPDTSDGPPRVSQILDSLEDGDQALSTGTRRTTGKDSPAAGAPIDDQSVPISFKRGRRIALGRMKIPAISLETRFFEGVTDESVEMGPGHWPGTPLPGAPGNSVFAGHRTTYTHPFEDLDLLKRGNTIWTGLRNAKPTTYRVFNKTIVAEADYSEFVLRQPEANGARVITLFACTPKGSRTHRIVVQAKAVSPGTAGGETSERGAMS